MQVFLAILMAITGIAGVAILYDAANEQDVAKGKFIVKAAGALLAVIVVRSFV